MGHDCLAILSSPGEGKKELTLLGRGTLRKAEQISPAGKHVASGGVEHRMVFGLGTTKKLQKTILTEPRPCTNQYPHAFGVLQSIMVRNVTRASAEHEKTFGYKARNCMFALSFASGFKGY